MNHIHNNAYLLVMTFFLAMSQGLFSQSTDSISSDTTINVPIIMRSAQNPELKITEPHYISKSPNVSGLLGQIDIPVSYYTGIPEISTPLYEIVIDNIKLPINVEYQASGIRVFQEATWVGLGWNLSIGGIISRTVRCGDDLFENYPPGNIREGYLTASDVTMPESSGYFIKRNYDVAWYRTFLIKDSEPDIFYFSANGTSGKFLVTPDSGVVLLDKSINAQITLMKADNGLYYFSITTNDGAVYNYRTRESTTTQSRPGYINKNSNNASCFDEYDDKLNLLYSSPFTYTSSWFLSEIITPHGKTIKFDYEQERYQSPVMEQAMKYNILSYDVGITGPGNNVEYSCSKTIVDTWRLSKISWDAGNVVFKSSSREDETSGQYGESPMKCDSIIISDGRGNHVRSFAMSYGYFNNDYSGDYPHVFKRLRLDRIICCDDTTCCYQFDYYDGNLPAKNSNSTDYWGFYNGRNLEGQYYYPVIFRGKKYAGGDRTPSFEHTQYSTLKSITVPTKGKTSFTYEANEYSVPPAMQVVTKHVKENVNVYYENEYNTYNQYPKTKTVRFTTQSPTQFKIGGCAENEGCVEDPDISAYDSDTYYTFALWKLNGNGRQLIEYYPVPSELSTSCSFDFEEKAINLSPGEYEIEAIARMKDTWFAFRIEYDKTDTIMTDSIMTGGGLRIQKISGDVVKTYQYEGGKMLINPQYSRKSFFYEIQAETSGEFETLNILKTDYLVQLSESCIPVSTLSGGNIMGYSTVTEYKENTFTKYHYFNEQEENYGYETPYTPTVMVPMNGKLLKMERGGKETVTYNYTSIPGQVVHAFVYDQDYQQICPYSYEISYPMISSVEKRIHETNGDILTNTSYLYNSRLQIECETISEGGETYQWHYAYPDSTVSDIHRNMVMRNLIGTPYETLFLKNGKVIRGIITEYIDTMGMILPKTESELELSNPIEKQARFLHYSPRIVYDHYDRCGNPIQITVNGQPSIYLWSYNGMYPIAEIRNATISDISPYLSLGLINNISTLYMPTNAMYTRIESLRSSLNDSFVSTLYYKPLIGMTMIRDPRGYTTSYDYDTMGRLSRQAHYRGNVREIEKEYEYNYRSR